MRQGLLQVLFLLASIGLSGNAAAQDYTNKDMGLVFKFQQSNFLLQPRLRSTIESPDSSKTAYRLAQPPTLLRTYDAIFYYPLHRRGVSIDLGVNLRLQQDALAQVDQGYAHGQDWLSLDSSETRTLIHAAAVFDLPFSGFKAGLSGTYSADLADTGYDYQAKLSYKWRNGLGMEGGWQHQQKSFDQFNSNDTFDVQTLFLDLNYRF